MQPYPMWVVVCSMCEFVGTRWEKPGTSASYIKNCPSCGGGRVTNQEVLNPEQHEAVREGEVEYDDIVDGNPFENA